ncbi:MAG: hypothetical protein II956_08745 [Bacteroidales bacterium]|nr:hypothetical protein [Bacteroidales bacterium]
MKKFFLILTLIFAFTASYAQKQDNVSWNFSSKNLSNGSVELVFNATINEGFRMYSPYNPAGASMPLSIILDENQAFTTDGKIIETDTPQEHYEEIFDVTEKFFRGKAEFKIVIKPVKNEPFTVTGKIKGQACDDNFMCTMVKKDFSIDVTTGTQKKKSRSKRKAMIH